MKVQKFERMVDFGYLVTNNTVGTTNGNYFQLADLPAYSEFTTLFDQYKIDKVEVWFKSQQRGITLQALANHGCIYFAVDYDDVTTPSSAAALQQYENCVVIEPEEDMYIEFKPHIAVSAFTSSGFGTGYSNLKDQWIDIASPNVEHYGMKYLTNADNLGGSYHNYWHILAKYHISCRNTR